MNEFIERGEHEEFVKRMEEEHKRQNHRLSIVEKSLEQNNKLLVSVEKLALSMENMQKEQKEQGERLAELESRDGEMWRKTVADIIKILLGGLLGFVLTQLGLG